MDPKALVLYYRNGCHLCEELAAVLYRGWPDKTDAIEWRDVDASQDWRDQFGGRVPVLLQGDVVICELKPDVRLIAHYFGEPEHPI